MQYYAYPFTFDFVTSTIDVDQNIISIDCYELYTACKETQASEIGIIYDAIAVGSGLETLSQDVKVGITVRLLGDWKIRFKSGNYIAKISGGNLVGGPGLDPIAYSDGVHVLLIQSAAATVVSGSGGGGLTVTQNNKLMSIPDANANASATLTALNNTIINIDEILENTKRIPEDPAAKSDVNVEVSVTSPEERIILSPRAPCTEQPQDVINKRVVNSPNVIKQDVVEYDKPIPREPKMTEKP